MTGLSINARSSIRLDCGKVLRFDPYRVTKEAHDADIVLVTHEHFDHWSPEDIRRVIKHDTIMVAPVSMKELVKREFPDEIADFRFLDPTEPENRLRLFDISIGCVRAYNIGKPFHTKDRDWIGYLVDVSGTTYFIMGDTDANEDNLNVKCDVLLIPCGGKYTFNAVEAAKYTAKIKPKKVIPTHYSDMPGAAGEAKVFAKELEKLDSGIEVEILV